MKCYLCDIEGEAGPLILSSNNIFDELLNFLREHKNIDGPLLFKIDNEYYCFLCQCKLTSTCFNCYRAPEKLFKDKRCRNNSYVCKNCLKNSNTNHVWTCYSDGCITPKEVAQEEWEILKMEEES